MHEAATMHYHGNDKGLLVHLFQTEATGREVNIQYCHYFDVWKLFAIIFMPNLYKTYFLLEITLLFPVFNGQSDLTQAIYS